VNRDLPKYDRSAAIQRSEAIPTNMLRLRGSTKGSSMRKATNLQVIVVGVLCDAAVVERPGQVVDRFLQEEEWIRNLTSS